MELNYSPGTCSLSIHTLLEEIGKRYGKAAISPRGGDQYTPGCTKGNRKSKMPALVHDDGSILTEAPAIALWITQSNPRARLLPTVARALPQEGLAA